MIGIVDIGGGMRDVYGAGILDYCIDNDILFDYCLGVSAGSGNLASYLGHHRGRCLRFYKDYISRPEYMSISNYIKNGSYINLDYVYGTMTNEGGEDPLNIDNIIKSGSILKSVATEASTGRAKYFDNSDLIRNDYGMLKSSCCIPIVCKPYTWQGIKYFDGGIADPVPVEKAFQDGCDKVLLIMTRPIDYREAKDKNHLVFKLIENKYPKIYDMLQTQHARYNEAVDSVINKYSNTGKLMILAPDDCCGVDTLTKNPDSIQRLYDKGYNDAQKINSFLSPADNEKRLTL